MNNDVDWTDSAVTYDANRANLVMCADSLLIVVDALASACAILFEKGIAVELCRDKIDDLLDIRTPLKVIKEELEREND